MEHTTFGTPLHEVLKEGIRYKMDAVPSTAKNGCAKQLNVW